ncbi:PREDICTED: HMG box-containing protein 1-like isoform X2 [Priapulus caudatus]|nr:PREDICTED: HMG box-containing protein 1-like isoform X2 [Priapulus caudatus]
MEEFSRSLLELNGGSSPSKLLRCPEEGCQKVLTSSPGLRYHLKTHTSGDNRPYCCSKCQKTFKSSNGLKYHLEKTRCDDASAFSGSGEEESSAPEDDEEDTQEHLEHGGALSKAKRDIPQLRDPDQCEQNTAYTRIQDQCSSDAGFLTELAIIATSPQSPLMMKPRLWSPMADELSMIHSYARPPRSRSVSPPGLLANCSLYCKQESYMQQQKSEDGDTIVPLSSASSSSQVTSSTNLGSPIKSANSKSDNWSHTWPTAVWQCFMQTCRIKFLSGPRAEHWQPAELLARMEALTAKAEVPLQRRTPSYAPEGLRLVQMEELRLSQASNAAMNLTFTPDPPGQPSLIANCPLDHPFFVRDRGWSSFCPALTMEYYGIPCREMEVGDVCLPPNHPEASFTTEAYECLRNYDLTPEDSTAVFMLSSMARQKRDLLEVAPMKPVPSSKSRMRHKSEPTLTRVKRPMNAFMLFAKRYRLEYTQQHPGRDNRAISVLLGDKWRKLRIEERRLFTQEARLLADEHRKMHPDCWKRKRSTSLNLDA